MQSTIPSISQQHDFFIKPSLQTCIAIIKPGPKSLINLSKNKDDEGTCMMVTSTPAEYSFTFLCRIPTEASLHFQGARHTGSISFAEVECLTGPVSSA